MSGYKRALDRFEAAVREHASLGARAETEHEYQEAKAALIRKLQYRQLAAEQRKLP